MRAFIFVVKHCRQSTRCAAISSANAYVHVGVAEEIVKPVGCPRRAGSRGQRLTRKQSPSQERSGPPSSHPWVSKGTAAGWVGTSQESVEWTTLKLVAPLIDVRVGGDANAYQMSLSRVSLGSQTHLILATDRATGVIFVAGGHTFVVVSLGGPQPQPGSQLALTRGGRGTVDEPAGSRCHRFDQHGAAREDRRPHPIPGSQR